MTPTVEDLKHSIENHNGVYPDELTPELLQEADCLPIVALLPKDFTARIQHLGNLLAQMCFANKHGDEVLRIELRQLAQAMSYLLNSSSFHDGKYHAYDRAELNRKLGRCREREA